MAGPFVAEVKVHHISRQQFSHAVSQGRVPCPNQQMKVLCEALDYVKWGFFLSGFFFIFFLWSIFYCT
jgi:hypothetical protein